MTDAARKLLALHPLLLEEAILQRAVTGMSLDARLALVENMWTSSTALQPENEDLLRDLALRAAEQAQDALENGQIVAPPSASELQHLLMSDVSEVRLVGMMLLRSSRNE